MSAFEQRASSPQILELTLLFYAAGIGVGFFAPRTGLKIALVGTAWSIIAAIVSQDESRTYIRYVRNFAIYYVMNLATGMLAYVGAPRFGISLISFALTAVFGYSLWLEHRAIDFSPKRQQSAKNPAPPPKRNDTAMGAGVGSGVLDPLMVEVLRRMAAREVTDLFRGLEGQTPGVGAGLPEVPNKLGLNASTRSGDEKKDC